MCVASLISTLYECSAHRVTFLSCMAKWQVRLIGHVMSNAIDNAKMHGLANGQICLYLDYNGTQFMLTLVNQPGGNHQAALDRQAALGTGFMFSDLPFPLGHVRKSFENIQRTHVHMHTV